MASPRLTSLTMASTIGEVWKCRATRTSAAASLLTSLPPWSSSGNAGEWGDRPILLASRAAASDAASTTREYLAYSSKKFDAPEGIRTPDTQFRSSGRPVSECSSACLIWLVRADNRSWTSLAEP
jgi:hypothetical protein